MARMVKHIYPKHDKDYVDKVTTSAKTTQELDNIQSISGVFTKMIDSQAGRIEEMSTEIAQLTRDANSSDMAKSNAITEFINWLGKEVKTNGLKGIPTEYAFNTLQIPLYAITQVLSKDQDERCDLSEQAIRLFRQAATGSIDSAYISRLLGDTTQKDYKTQQLVHSVKPVVDLIAEAEKNRVELITVTKELEKFRAEKGKSREFEELKAEVTRLKKIEKAPNSDECNRYVEYIKQLNSKMHAMQQVVDQYKKLRGEHEVLFGRYEMLRVQYVRLRTRRMTATPAPDFIAGRGHPCNPKLKYVSNLSKLKDTEQAIRKSTHGRTDKYGDDLTNTLLESKQEDDDTTMLENESMRGFHKIGRID